MAADALHAVASHATDAASHAEAIPELPNVITLLSHRWHDVPWVAALHHWENLVFAAVIAIGLSLVAWRACRRPATVPWGWQNLLELFVESMDRLVCSIIGPEGRRFTPFIGTLFLYIWLMNLSGLVPGFKSSTANLNTTAALAITVFLYVQGTGMRHLGLVGYLDHLVGQPRDLVGWLMVPLLLPIHVLGEFIKPLSLSLRLCINVFAEDVMLAVVVGLGLTLGIAMHLPVGVPLQVLVFPLVLIFSTVQALVFSLLSTVYLAMMVASEGHHQ